MTKTVEQLEAENAELRATIESSKDPALDSFEADTEVTACMLCCNAWTYLPFTIPALIMQGVRMDVMTYLDQQSGDPTQDILESPRLKTGLEKHPANTIREYRYLGALPHFPMERILALAKGNFTHYASTKYLLFVDADVLLDNNTAREMLEILKADDKLGAVAVPYRHKTDHPEQGALMLSKELAEQVKFQYDPRCVCSNLARAVTDKGLAVRHWERKSMADHLKYTRRMPPKEVQDADL